MKRKEYKAFAAALAASRPNIERYTTRSGENTFVNSMAFGYATQQWQNDVDAIARVLAADNPLFDRERFYEATEA